jgi:hypothetical protein
MLIPAIVAGRSLSRSKAGVVMLWLRAALRRDGRRHAATQSQ